eukprot:446958_1
MVSTMMCSLLCLVKLAYCGAASVPNILFMLIDDLGWNDISFHNGCDYSSPNIDSLQKNALTLDNYYVQYMCSPTRSTIMTGLYPIHTGFQHYVIQPDDPYGLPLNYSTLPQELKKVGYKTHMLGKWHLGYFNGNYTPNYRGFDSYFGYYLGNEDYYWHNRSDGEDNSHNDGFDFHNNSKPVFINDTYSTYIYGNMTLDILHKYATNNDPNKSPFFIYIPFQAVHAPLQAPQNVIDSYNKTIFNYQRSVKAAMVKVLDDTIGDIIDAIKNKYKLWDNLLLVWSTDNGGPIYKGEAASNWPLRGGKQTNWEGGVRAAGFISGGYLNEKRRGQISQELMHSTDWLPTICDMVGVIPSNKSILDGFSMKHVIQNNNKSPRTEILHNIDPVNCHVDICGSIRINEWKLSVGNEVEGKGCISGWCYTYGIMNGSNYDNTTVKCGSNHVPIQNYSAAPYNGKPVLYNIIEDPCEYNNVAEENMDVVNQLYQRLAYYNSTQVTPLQLLNPPEPNLANPVNFNGFWTSWRNSSHQNQ